jgi:hypothetical protein
MAGAALRIVGVLMVTGLAGAMMASGAVAQGALPPAPSDVAARPGVGPGELFLDWTPTDAGSGVTHYNIYGGPGLQGPLHALAEVGEDGDPYLAGWQWRHGGLQNSQTWRYVVAAVNDAGEGPPSAVASSTTFLACVQVCVGLHPVERLGYAELPNASAVTPAAAVTVHLEIGRVRLDALGTYVEQAVAVPQAEGLPDPGLLNQPAVGLSYRSEGGPTVMLQPGPDPSPDDPLFLGSVWSGRFWVYFTGQKLTDVPFAVVYNFPSGEPGSGAGVPDAGVLGALAAVGVAGLALRARPKSGR